MKSAFATPHLGHEREIIYSDTDNLKDCLLGWKEILFIALVTTAGLAIGQPVSGLSVYTHSDSSVERKVLQISSPVRAPIPSRFSACQGEDTLSENPDTMGRSDVPVRVHCEPLMRRT